MGWFSKRGIEAKSLAQHQEKIASRIAEKILAVQRSTAAKLNAQAERMGVVKMIIVLGALLFGFACYLIYIMVNAVC